MTVANSPWPSNLPRKMAYIAGPISGDPDKDPHAVRYARAMKYAHEAAILHGELVEKGWAVHNPYASVPAGGNWEIPQPVWYGEGLAFIHLIGLALQSGLIERAMLVRLNVPGVEKSKGVKREYDYAASCGLEVDTPPEDY